MATKVNAPLNYVSLFSCAGVGCYGFKQEGFGTPMFYSFENYMTVLDTGFSSSFFMGLEQDDYNSVLSGIEMNYK